MIHVECVFSPAPRENLTHRLALKDGTTVVQALQIFKTAVANQCTDTGHAVTVHEALSHATGQGVWGRKVPLSHVLKDGDRLEIYRALKVDPKLARKQRFNRQGKGRTGLFAKRREGAVPGY
jgi:putative ubiquitin-RnfH superfamily antitoxin RatB of RatAB toxin-antitoxin module